jgi:hypothetical protein
VTGGKQVLLDLSNLFSELIGVELSRDKCSEFLGGSSDSLILQVVEKLSKRPHPVKPF